MVLTGTHEVLPGVVHQAVFGACLHTLHGFRQRLPGTARQVKTHEPCWNSTQRMQALNEALGAAASCPSVLPQL